MAKTNKKPVEAQKKCKPSGPSRPWMIAFLDEALKTADVPLALKKNDVGWGDYVRARREDLAFDLECQEVDLVVRQALTIRLEAQAAAGDLKAARLLAGGLAEIRKILAEQGALLEQSRTPRHPELVVSGISHPRGPCLECMGGLIWNEHPTFGTVIIRNEAARFWEIPIPDEYPDCVVIYAMYDRNSDPFGSRIDRLPWRDPDDAPGQEQDDAGEETAVD